MFDKYIICEDGFSNIQSGDKVTGFQLQYRIPYYRGIGISMIQGLNIKIDGEAIPRESIKVTLHGNTYSLDEMETEYTDRWEFGEKGLVTVEKPGGLPPGEHTIEANPHVRVSYIPFILTAEDAKTLTITG